MEKENSTLESMIAKLSLHPSKVDKPWGFYVTHYLADDVSTCFKTLVIMPGEQISLQTHDKRSEFWFISHGDEFKFIVGREEDTNYSPSWLFIEQGQQHWIHNSGTIPLVINEMQMGTCLESDIVRIYDPYQRVSTE